MSVQAFYPKEYVSVIDRAMTLQELQTLQDRIPEISAQDMAIKYMLACVINERINAAAYVLEQKTRLDEYDALPWWRKALWGLNGA